MCHPTQAWVCWGVTLSQACLELPVPGSGSGKKLRLVREPNLVWGPGHVFRACLLRAADLTWEEECVPSCPVGLWEILPLSRKHLQCVGFTLRNESPSFCYVWIRPTYQTSGKLEWSKRTFPQDMDPGCRVKMTCLLLWCLPRKVKHVRHLAFDIIRFLLFYCLYPSTLPQAAF